MKLKLVKVAILRKYEVCLCLSLKPECTKCTECTLGMKLELVKGAFLKKYVCVCLSNLSVPSAPSAP